MGQQSSGYCTNRYREVELLPLRLYWPYGGNRRNATCTNGRSRYPRYAESSNTHGCIPRPVYYSNQIIGCPGKTYIGFNQTETYVILYYQMFIYLIMGRTASLYF